VLKDGRIVEQGRHSELMARNGLYRQIYRSQLSENQDSE
jgi:ABC-type multidrug transport system fused ATPase/permease subunit